MHKSISGFKATQLKEVAAYVTTDVSNFVSLMLNTKAKLHVSEN
jgi:hypothetical protein